jgi:hypothetical protein
MTKYTKIYWVITIILLISFSSNVSSSRILDIQENIVNLTSLDSSLKIYSNEHNVFGKDYGESIELHALKNYSKAFIGWYGYDPVLGDNTPIGWIGCHYSLTNGDKHQHCSWETLDNNTGKPSINTKFEIKYGSNLSKNDPELFARISGVNKFIIGKGVDLYFSDGAADIVSRTEMDIYPNNQYSKAFRIASDNNYLILRALGTSLIKIIDSLIIDGDLYVENKIIFSNLSGEGNAYLCIDNMGQLYRSKEHCNS